MAEVVLDKICKTFGSKYHAITDLSLTIHDGEFLILVGPSGCGKSTALRMIAGLEEITSGTLSIGGENVVDLAPKDRDIAMVFQNYALYPHMTVFDNIAISLTRLVRSALLFPASFIENAMNRMRASAIARLCHGMRCIASASRPRVKNV